MRDSTSYADTVTDWEELLTAIEQNGEDLPQLEIPRSEKLVEFALQPLRFRQRSAAGDNPLPQPE